MYEGVFLELGRLSRFRETMEKYRYIHGFVSVLTFVVCFAPLRRLEAACLALYSFWIDVVDICLLFVDATNVFEP